MKGIKTPLKVDEVNNTHESSDCVAALDLFVVPVIVTDDEGVIQHVNAAARALSDVLQEGEQFDRSEEDNTSFDLKLLDGSQRSFSSTISYVDDPNHGKRRVYHLFDVTELENNKELLKAQSEELRRSNEELEQFAYVASHDLQEPLRMIGSYVQLISKRLEKQDSGELTELMDFAIDGVRRMQLLIDDLLQYSRVNRKGEPFKEENLNEIFETVVQALGEKIKSTEATIKCEPLPETVMADGNQLYRLFMNLIDNALKFGREDAPPRVEISVAENPSHWYFKIKDYGIGIDPKFYDRVFVIFQRLHSRKDYQGTGIGLAICKKIVERHGGEIWIDSIPAESTTFHFTINKD